MWQKVLAIILLFYLFSLLQNSFFASFRLFGAIPNLVFIIFFLFVFFEKKNRYRQVVFYAIAAGLFVDLFSSAYFGISVGLFLIIGLVGKKVQALLQEKKNNEFPFAYFLPLFTFSFAVYFLLSQVFFNKLNVAAAINLGFLVEIIYNLLVACVGFYVCKRFLGFGFNDRQLTLFKK